MTEPRITCPCVGEDRFGLNEDVVCRPCWEWGEHLAKPALDGERCENCGEVP